jgi:tryptophanase
MFGANAPARQLVRFALPRRVYTQSHVDYVGAVAADVAERKAKLPAMRITAGQDTRLRHFVAEMKPDRPFPFE